MAAALCLALALGLSTAGAAKAGGSSVEDAASGSERPTRQITVYAGKSSPDTFTSILFSPWSVDFEDTELVAGTYTQQITDLGSGFWLDGEVGIGKRFGDSDAWEFFGTVFLRYDGLPWNDTLYTTLGVGIGPSYATSISQTEKDKSGNDKGARTLNMLVPEVTFALPEHKDAQLVLRLHHRSGVFGLFNGVTGGSTFVSLGLRIGF